MTSISNTLHKLNLRWFSSSLTFSKYTTFINNLFAISNTRRSKWPDGGSSVNITQIIDNCGDQFVESTCCTFSWGKVSAGSHKEVFMYARWSVACTMSEILPLPTGSHWHAGLRFSERNVVFYEALCAPESLVEQFLYQSKAAGWKSTSWADSGAATLD